MPPSHVRIIDKILNVCTIIGQILGEVIKHKANKGQKADVRNSFGPALSSEL